MKNYSNGGYENKTFNKVISVCSEVKDGICSTGCASGADYDCCTNAGKCWRPGQGCYDTC